MGRRKFLMAAGFMAAAVPAPALAATPPNAATAKGQVLLLLPLTLTEVNDLRFGTIVSSAVAGTVTINAKTGSRTHSGGVTEVASDRGQRALFAWDGTPGQQVSFDLTYPTTLDDGKGNSVQVALLYLETTSATADSSGIVKVGAGGSILIAANQPEGLYSNTFTVTANYQ